MKRASKQNASLSFNFEPFLDGQESNEYCAEA